MADTSIPQESQKFEIQAYKRPKNLSVLSETHVAFTGCPQKHPYDPLKVIVVTDPYSANTSYYEFQTAQVAYVEELPSLVNLEGETVNMARLWVRKGSVGIRSTPFLVADTAAGGK